MSHFEKIVFKPNPDNFELALDEIKSFIQKYRQQLSYTLNEIKFDTKKISQWEDINHKKLIDVFPGDFNSFSFSPDPLMFGNESILTFDTTAQTITWTNYNPVYSMDCLMFLDTIENYKIWQPESYAVHQIGKGPNKTVKTYGWKNINYKKWFKKSSKI